MISIITVVNNNNIFEQWLGSSLKMQEGIEYELITIDNTKNTYSSLEKAYMNGVMQAAGDWLMFVHPDVKFLHENTLKAFFENVKRFEINNPNIKLWGVAGAEDGVFTSRNFITAIVHGTEPDLIPNNFNGREYVIVQTVDACCYFIKKETIDKYEFSCKLSGFHMLVEELCIRLKEDGFDSAVIPVNLWHRSKGESLDYTYFLAVLNVLRLHPRIEYLNTTTIHGKVNIKNILKLVLYEIKFFWKFILSKFNK